MSAAVATTYSNIGVGLDAWVQFAKSIRLMGRGGAKYPPFGQGNSALSGYYTGTGVIASILVLAFFATFFASIGQCVVLCCCRKSLRAKREKLLRRVIKPSSKLCAISWLLILSVIFSVGAFSSYTGGAVLGSSVALIGVSAGGILDSSQAVIRRLSPGINVTFDSVNQIVGDAIDDSPSSIDTSRLSTEGVNSNMAELIVNLREISALIDRAVNDAASTSATYSELSNTINTLSTNVSSILSTINGWNSPGLDISGGTYQTGYSPPTISFSSLNANFSSIPNGRDQLDPIKNIEMSKTISDYSATSTGLAARITSAVRTANAPIKSNLANAVVLAKGTIMGAITSLEGATDKTFDGGRNQLKGFISTVETYNAYRSISMIILSSCIFLVMLVVALGFFRQKPVLVKGCNLCATPMYLLVQFLAIIIFILAVLFGDICSSVFEYTPAPILNALDSSMGDPIVQLTTLRDECSNNVSIIQVAVDVKLVKSDDVNITLQLDNTVKAVNLSGISDLYLEPLVWLTSGTPSTIVSPLTSLDLTLLGSSSVDPKVTATDSDLTSISNTLNSISAQVSSLSVSYTGFSYSPDNANQRTLAQTDYNTRANSMISSISVVVTEISNLKTKLSNYRSALTGSLLSNATAAKGNSSSWGTNANARYVTVRSSMSNFSNYAKVAINDYPPVMRARISSRTSQTELGLRRNTTCFDLGTSVFALQDAVCGQYVGGLDSLWMAYAWISIGALISIPAVIYAANRLLLRNIAVYVEIPDFGPKRLKAMRDRSAIKRTYPMASADEMEPIKL